MRHLVSLVVALVAAIVPGTAVSDCAADRQNLVADANCSFDRDVAGWQAAPGDAAAGHDAGEGQPRAGALRADGGPQGSITIHGPCITAGPGIYEVGGSIKTASGTPYYCGVDVYQYADERCEVETAPVVSAGLPPREDWQQTAASGVTDGDTVSLRLRVGCSGKPGFVVLFDDVFLARR